MTPVQIALVQTSFEAVADKPDVVADLFYGRLFELDPSLRALFSGDMREQGRKLMLMIATAVRSLDNLAAIVPAVQALGERHVGYGVKDGDYDVVGAALLWTLEKGLGPAFTPETKVAWTETYTLLASTMKDAAHKIGAA
jgi:hemoglobin-like flavoprotein